MSQITEEFRINDYITLKLENGKTYIYINNKRYIQCLKLLLTLRKEHQFDSIDQMEFSNLYHVKDSHETTVDITAKEEFTAHCSSLQAFAENNYNTNLLHRSISFQLLKKLYEVDDPVAKIKFIPELKKRCENGHPRMILFLIEDKYLLYLGDNWFIDQLNNPDSKVVENLTIWIEKNSILHYLPALDIFFKHFVYHIERCLCFKTEAI